METIKNYLETMFANLPNTAEVLRAKRELGQMMEDKYNELISEGKSENEAVGAVIADFGNLDELAEDLGLKKEVEEERALMEASPRRFIGLDEAKTYIRFTAMRALGIGIAVALCILCATGPIMADGIPGIPGVLGVIALFGMLVVAIAIFILIGTAGDSWKHLDKELCSIDYSTANYVNNERERFKFNHAAELTIGIILCAACWIPAAVLGESRMLSASRFADSLSAVMLLVFVAVGVFLIIHSSLIMGGYEKLLKLNDRDTVGGSYVPEFTERYSNQAAGTVLKYYWPTVRAIYLIWSFLTFAWWRTWIIWPLAAVIHSIIKGVVKTADNEEVAK